ncbi:signal transduction histidine kinase [Actinoplanes lutulentus]|uniref:histidine kinase n=1 Tax=Actinoplanes lutulentus TaxID=1287878 RepID=A0A327Z978_9ACTN|nr:GAF domain-containing protein [Actinoplanes lutulentus]MBB2946738.1 signal transduction histidine kinase [Actinoplanes lutulentus]RAK35630.1 GAF domain-containing protein [Actinoplanes lutulentus]
MNGAEQESGRLAALHEYRLFDTPPQEELRAVVRIAAAVAGVPTATLNLIDEHRQVMLTTVGFTGRDCDRDDSMCAIRLGTGQPVNLPDASLDPAYRNNPWVTGELGLIRFYANAPLITPHGHILGTLCVFDTEPHELSAEQAARLEDLAAVIVAFFERRRQTRVTAEFAAITEARKEWAEALLDGIDVAVVAIDTEFQATLYNRAARLSHDPDVDLGAAPVGIAERYQLFEPDGHTLIPDDEVPLMVALAGNGPVTAKEMILRRPKTGPATVRANARALYDAAGAITGAVVALQDVTAEATRKRLIEEARSRLAAANAELLRSNADLTNFAAAVSHDLVSPLAAVGGYLELLADEAGLSVEPATREVERMQNLIESLLSAAAADGAHGGQIPAEAADR